MDLLNYNNIYKDNMTLELDRVYTFKIANGDEIVTKITAEDADTYTVNQKEVTDIMLAA